jgi:hypothetical protein
VGFLTPDRVRKIALAGGVATTVCRARVPVRADWIDDTIYFADREGGVLNKVAARGGEPSELLSSFERLGYWGQVTSVLPGGRAALVSLPSRDSTTGDYAEIWVVPLNGGEPQTLPITGYGARYLPSGHLVFIRGGSVLAAPFDLDRLAVLGEAAAVLEGVTVESTFLRVHAAFSTNGTLAFVPGQDLSLGVPAWMDREGREGVLDLEEGHYGAFDLAAGDRSFALQVADVRDYIRVWDAEDGARDLALSGSTGWPVWSPDGTRLALWGRVPGAETFGLLLHEFRGGTTGLLVSSDALPAGTAVWNPESWVESDRIGISGWGSDSIGIVSVASPEDRVWKRGASGSGWGRWGVALSPAAPWVAYNSNEGTGRYQVWIEEIDGETRKQVSTDGGLEPVWCRACGELFYRHGNRVFASRIVFEPQFYVGAPRQVFVARDFVDTKGISFRVSSDGQRLYYVRRSKPPVRDRIHIIHNWFEELASR